MERGRKGRYTEGPPRSSNQNRNDTSPSRQPKAKTTRPAPPSQNHQVRSFSQGLPLERHALTHRLRFSRCARSTPLPSLRCRRPFTARRTLHACVTPGVYVPLPTTPLFARRRAFPRGRVRRPCRARAPCSAPFRARCARAPAAGRGAARGRPTRRRRRGSRARAQCRAAPRPRTCAGLRVRSADRELAVLRSLAPCTQPSSLVATPLHERADHTLGALAARVRH
jgi:hypothetical protein